MEDKPINQNYLIGCDTIEHSPSSALRRLLNRPIETPTTSFKQLSVHQLAFHTASQTYKIHKNQEPAYHYERLFNAPVNQETRSVNNIQTRVDFDLSLARKSFFYQAAHIWNALPAHMKTARTIDNFERSLKAWVMMHIAHLRHHSPVNNSYANWCYVMTINNK